jgi:hypothetical protein
MTEKAFNENEIIEYLNFVKRINPDATEKDLKTMLNVYKDHLEARNVEQVNVESKQDKREMDITEARKRYELRMRSEALKIAFDFSASVMLNNKSWENLDASQKYEQLKAIYLLAADNYKFIESGDVI